DHYRSRLRPGLDLAEVRKRRGEPRHPHGKSGRRHRLAAEAGHETIVAPAATNRSEAYGTAMLILRFEQEFDFVNRARVVLEAAHDRSIDFYAVLITSRPDQRINLAQLCKTGTTVFCCLNPVVQFVESGKQNISVEALVNFNSSNTRKNKHCLGFG